MQNNTRHYAIQGRRDSEADRVAYMIEHMAANKAYRYAVGAGGDSDGSLIAQFRERFQWYRKGWRALPHEAIEKGLVGESFRALARPPLCVDIEVASVCDLACPFCFRQWIATPDKIIDEELCYRLIDQCAEMGVPSMKFNWRGEPLLHPKLPQFIDHAKKRGIIETIINTDAVTLDEARAAQLIDAGLDLLIYSFDGGTPKTYERMRPGRFKENRFDAVYNNIKAFAKLRSEQAARFPRTKIQMVLTRETFHEQEAFFRLFEEIVDDVSVKQYTERGGQLTEADDETRRKLETALQERHLPPTAGTMRDMQGNLFIASGRLPCEQPYQRLLVTYDGRVSMCCYDWGSMHPVGYVDRLAIDLGQSEYEKVLKKARSGARGFSRLAQVEMPREFNRPAPVVQTLSEIWYGHEITNVRQQHVSGNLENVEICRSCPFKETYKWERLV